MSDIHEHMRAQVLRHKHKFPETKYRGVPITEFNAEELRALICESAERFHFMTNGTLATPLPEMKWRKLDEGTDVTNRPETGRQHD